MATKRPIVYLTLADHINNYSYPLSGITENYGPRYAYELSNDTAGPMRTGLYGETGSGNYSIKTMIDMDFKGVSFSFVDWEDAINVQHIVALYAAELKKTLVTSAPKNKQKSLSAYLERTEAFLERLTMLCNRLRQKHKDTTKEICPVIFKAVQAYHNQDQARIQHRKLVSPWLRARNEG